MQKKIIALAIAGLSATSAFAADTVTLYGVADMYVGSADASWGPTVGAANSTSVNRRTLVNSGGLATSRIGFKGVEDLGSGLKALFVLEYGIGMDTNQALGGGGTTGTGARQQMVGLTGDFGTAVAGRLQTAAYDWAVAYDVLAGTAISPLQNLTSPTGAGALSLATTKTLIGGATSATRASNALAYISPSLGGVTLAANYSTNVIGSEAVVANGVADNANLKAYLLSAKYDNGPVSVGLVIARAKNDAATTGVVTAGTAYDRADWALGASYNFGVATLKATYQTTKDKTGVNTVAAPQADNADRTWSLGVAVPVSAAGTVVGSYASTKVNSAVTATVADVSAKSYTVGYLHGLSKRTTLYTGYNRVTNDNGVNFMINNNATQATLASGLTNAPGGTTSSIFVAGVNHKF